MWLTMGQRQVWSLLSTIACFSRCFRRRLWGLCFTTGPTGLAKKAGPQTIILSSLNRFKIFFTRRFLGKFAVKRILKPPPNLAYVVYTIPCETLMSAKQAVNDKLQGSVATYLRCGKDANIQINSGLLLSLRMNYFFLNRWIFVKVTSKSMLVSCTLCAWPKHGWRTMQVHKAITFLPVTLSNICRFKKVTDRLSNKPFLIWLLTTPPHL